jgi:hypothetical protein
MSAYGAQWTRELIRTMSAFVRLSRRIGRCYGTKGQYQTDDRGTKIARQWMIPLSSELTKADIYFAVMP